MIIGCGRDYSGFILVTAGFIPLMIVRNLKGYGLNAIRVTIGTPEQNDRFFALIEPLL
jgi:hypothetical protein